MRVMLNISSICPTLSTSLDTLTKMHRKKLQHIFDGKCVKKVQQKQSKRFSLSYWADFHQTWKTTVPLGCSQNNGIMTQS